MTRPEIPDKIYFKIGEAADLLDVETHVLRYWESEFPQIKPVRAGSNQRLYRRQDLETLFEIKRLLHEEKFTVAGARKKIGRKARNRELAGAVDFEDLLLDIKNELTEISSLLKK